MGTLEGMIWVHACRSPSILTLLEITSGEQAKVLTQDLNRRRDRLIDMTLLHGNYFV
jgi:hypothetical protein